MTARVVATAAPVPGKTPRSAKLEAVERVFESETNFMMLILKNHSKVLELLKKHKIHVLDCSLSIPHSIRVSIGTEEQNRRFIEVMEEASSLS